MKIIDLSQALSHHCPVFPGDGLPQLTQSEGEGDFVSYRLDTSLHTATHIDAPFHINADQIAIGNYGPDLFCGKACVIDVCGKKLISYLPRWQTQLEGHPIVLFRTLHSQNWGQDSYMNEYPEFDTSVAEALLHFGVHIAGFDSPSPDKEPFRFHKTYLRDGHFIVENLRGLELLPEGETFYFQAMPLRLMAEASPVRAVAMLEGF